MQSRFATRILSTAVARVISSTVLAFAILLSPALARAASTQSIATSEGLSATEFSRLVRDFSEEGGYFNSDNFTSNETAYLTVVEKLRQLGGTGGAYVGVGPEQNFTYIAKVRPRIAFIIDIRRQAIIQHLMYKAVFHLAPDRVQFLSKLFSRPLTKDAPKTTSTTGEMLTYFTRTPGDEKIYDSNLAAIRKAIEQDFQFPLSKEDQTSLEYVYKSFYKEGLEISFRLDGNWNGGYFPSLKDLILETDLAGKQGNFLASNEDYDFVRGMHARNLIVPVVGDFGGKKALVAVGDYLKKSGMTVTAFYTSNVEQYLFESGSFSAFANNVRKFPLNERSLFIRSVSARYSHPAQLPGHRSTTLLQQISVFLKEFDAGKYGSYRDMMMSNYITGQK
ncbi:MAG TPA: hypothetical protein VKM94_04430 [Blastocatellia bacterium]|nr:hypothetical protein [Blastocatellia bacterium]